MSIEAVRAVCVREIDYLRHHHWDLALVSWVPALAIATIWWIFSSGVSIKQPIALVDEDHSQDSRALARALDATRSIAIAARPATLEAAGTLVRQRRVYAVVQVPYDWQRRAQRRDRLPIVLYTNEQYHAVGTSIATDVMGAVVAVTGQRGLAALASLGGGFSGAERRAGAVRVELRSLYAPQLSFERALSGALFPTTLHLFMLGGAAFAIGREFRDRTAGEWLRTARGSIVSALVGKLLPLFICFAVLGLAAIAWFSGYRGWSANGSLTLWYAALLSLILACCAIPAMLVGLTGTLRVALAICAISNVTAVSFTGFTYPLYSMSTAAKVWSQILPFHYFYEIEQQQWNIGAPLGASLVPLLILWTVFIVTPFAIAIPTIAARCRDPATWGRR